LDTVQKIWVPLRNLFAPPGVPSWLRACLATTRFGPQFAFSQRFEQRTWSLPHVFVWHTFLDNLFQMVACFNTVEQCSAMNNLRTNSALQLSKSGLVTQNIVLTLGSMQKAFSLIIWVFLLPAVPFKLTLFLCDCVTANFAKGFSWISRRGSRHHGGRKGGPPGF